MRIVQFMQAVIAHVEDGWHSVTGQQLSTRLQICEKCELRKDLRCTVCDCFIIFKASWRDQDCPEHRWPTT